jgi:hypothetical protein
MSFFDALRRFFSPTPEEKADKLTRRITNMYGQTDERRYALTQLHSMEPELAAPRLISRFTCQCENNTVDSEEKEYTKNLLVAIGEPAIEPLEAFLRANDKDFSWPFRTLAEILPHGDMVDFIVELLDSIGPEYVRDPERKEQLILIVKSYDEERIKIAVLPYLADDNETIRFVAADTVIAHAHPKGIEALSARLATESSQRVLTLIAGAFRDKEWIVSEADREAVSANLPTSFRLNPKGQIL